MVLDQFGYVLSISELRNEFSCIPRRIFGLEVPGREGGGVEQSQVGRGVGWEVKGGERIVTFVPQK